MNLSPRDLEFESRKQHAEDLAALTRAGLEDLRLRLERWAAAPSGASAHGGSDADAAEAVLARDALMAGLARLGLLLGFDKRLSSAGGAWTDRESLQNFRRAAESDLERLQAAYARLCAGEWRTGTDRARDQAVRASAGRWAWVLGLCALVLAAWWGWQRYRQSAELAALDAARTARAVQAVRLISLAAWQATQTQGKSLPALVQDMSADCSSMDVRTILPNHPCRQAWEKNAQALFTAAIPAPGKPINAPSEIFFDPWGAPYLLILPDQGPPSIVSAGPDGRLGTADDVSAEIPFWSR